MVGEFIQTVIIVLLTLAVIILAIWLWELQTTVDELIIRDRSRSEDMPDYIPQPARPDLSGDR